MTDTNSTTIDMDALAAQSAASVDNLYAADLEKLKSLTTPDWDALIPKVSNPDDLKKLIDAVQQATNNNESIAELQDRILKLGDGVVSLVKNVSHMV